MSAANVITALDQSPQAIAWPDGRAGSRWFGLSTFRVLLWIHRGIVDVAPRAVTTCISHNGIIRAAHVLCVVASSASLRRNRTKQL